MSSAAALSMFEPLIALFAFAVIMLGVFVVAVVRAVHRRAKRAWVEPPSDRSVDDRTATRRH